MSRLIFPLPLSAFEGPGEVPVFEIHHLRRPIAMARGHAVHPDIRGLVDVTVCVDDDAIACVGDVICPSNCWASDTEQASGIGRR